jgi:hypothetical protein
MFFRFRSIIVVAGLGALAGCGLGDPVTAAAVGGVAKAKELEQARQTQERLLRQIEQVDQDTRSRLDRAEAANQ